MVYLLTYSENRYIISHRRPYFMYKLTCKVCGKEFENSFKDVKICDECKNRPCVVCGKQFVRPWPYDQKTCSAECRAKLRKDPENIARKEEKKRATVKAKYGLDNVSQIDSVREKIRSARKDISAYRANKAAQPKPEPTKRVRRCVLCGKEFDAIGFKTICPRVHTRNCEVCGKPFIIKRPSDKRKTCSRECWTALSMQTAKGAERTCIACGKTFHSASNSARYCDGPHYKKCVICGSIFEVKYGAEGFTLDTAPKTCSDKCSSQLAKQTNMIKYGVESPNQLPEYREHFRQTTLASQDKRISTNMARYGFPYAQQNPEFKANLSNVISSEDNQSKMRLTMQERYGVDYAMQSSNLLSKQRSSKGHITACDGRVLDSSWEKIFYDFLTRNEIPFEYNSVTIPYQFKGKDHVLHVDFKVGDILFEVKGDHLLQGVGDNSNVPIEAKIELYKKHHIIVICESNVNNIFGKPNSSKSNGLKYLNKCPEPLIGVDINLFNNPQFPFAGDRPPAFYKVKVDGALSSLDAFNDDKIRWKMILNRIMYSGGFIDSKQVLTAMNVTRTCKQPSWFAKPLAERIIEEYCSSETIVDCFAGWGMRQDATIALGRKYTGIDYNKEVVDWHNNHGRDIKWGDANDFSYSDPCSVFICPPYSDPSTGRCFDVSIRQIKRIDKIGLIFNG